MTRELSPEERATVVRFGIHDAEILRDLEPIEVWCEGCLDWWPLASWHGAVFPRRGSHRYPRRVRLVTS